MPCKQREPAGNAAQDNGFHRGRPTPDNTMRHNTQTMVGQPGIGRPTPSRRGGGTHASSTAADEALERNGGGQSDENDEAPRQQTATAQPTGLMPPGTGPDIGNVHPGHTPHTGAVASGTANAPPPATQATAADRSDQTDHAMHMDPHTRGGNRPATEHGLPGPRQALHPASPHRHGFPC